MMVVKFDSKNVNNFLKGTPTAIEKATTSTINKVAKQARTLSSKEIRDSYSIKASDLNKKLYTKSAYGTDNKAEIIGEGKGISLKYFGARQKATGVQVTVKRGNTKTISGAFGPKIDRLGGNVFRRVGKERLPIKKLLGPGVALMFSHIMPKTKIFIDENIIRIFKQQIDYFSKKY